MAEFIEVIKEWFFGLGDNYGVNPIILGSIYIGATPFFTLSLAWLVKNYKKGLSIVLPAISSTFFFVSSYLYIIYAGENVPIWVYGVVVVLLGGGSYATIYKIKKKVNADKDETTDDF